MIKFLLVDVQKLVRPRKYCKKINEDKEICKNVTNVTKMESNFKIQIEQKTGEIKTQFAF